MNFRFNIIDGGGYFVSDENNLSTNICNRDFRNNLIRMLFWFCQVIWYLSWFGYMIMTLTCIQASGIYPKAMESLKIYIPYLEYKNFFSMLKQSWKDIMSLLLLTSKMGMNWSLHLFFCKSARQEDFNIWTTFAAYESVYLCVDLDLWWSHFLRSVKCTESESIVGIWQLHHLIPYVRTRRHQLQWKKSWHVCSVDRSLCNFSTTRVFYNELQKSLQEVSGFVMSN